MCGRTGSAVVRGERQPMQPSSTSRPAHIITLPLALSPPPGSTFCDLTAPMAWVGEASLKRSVVTMTSVPAK